MRRSLRRVLHSISRPRQAASRITGKLSGALAFQRTGLFGPRVGLSDFRPGRRSRGFRLRGRALGALAFGTRLTRGMGLARGNDAAVRADLLSVVPALDHPVSVHSTHAAACGLDRKLTLDLLVTSYVGYSDR